MTLNEIKDRLLELEMSLEDLNEEEENPAIGDISLDLRKLRLSIGKEAPLPIRLAGRPLVTYVITPSWYSEVLRRIVEYQIWYEVANTHAISIREEDKEALEDCLGDLIPGEVVEW